MAQSPSSAVPLRVGMVGGGEGAFIGAVHRHALRLDGRCALVCGAFSSDAERAARSGAGLGLPPSRVYTDWREMLAREAALPADTRMEALSIVTPNHLHLEIAAEALGAGFHVISDKPATLDLPEARALQAATAKAAGIYALTHTYLGYPMVREARRLVREGVLGRVRKVYVEYTQGWLAKPPAADNKQASWRVDPSRSGIGGCISDIGSHAHNLAEFVTGARMNAVRAWLQNVVPDRALDDDVAMFCRFDGGISGILTASQVCAGEENHLRLRVYGEDGGLDWCQEEPNTLMIKYGDGRQERRRAGGGMPLGPTAAAICRTPSGHPEGYLEAFGTLYADVARQVRGEVAAGAGQDDIGFVPGIAEAVRGMAFVQAAVESSDDNGEWREIEDA